MDSAIRPTSFPALLVVFLQNGFLLYCEIWIGFTQVLKIGRPPLVSTANRG
jgi:hypothetical protein